MTAFSPAHLTVLGLPPPEMIPAAEGTPGYPPMRDPASMRETRTALAGTGIGRIDIAGILARMPQGIPLALEVPMQALTVAIGPEAVARRVREAAGRTLAPRAPRS